MISKKEFISKLYISLSISSFCILSLFLFTPMHIYFANINGGGLFCFQSSFGEVLANSLVLSSVLLMILTGIFFLIPAKLFAKTGIFIFTLTFLFWFFNTILIWDYGIFDGRTINWSKFNYRGFIDLFIYILVFL